ncbi:putative transcriptional regulator [Gottschalkia acidurici 9a]|uniref:Transcriptional regulator n=1 Tax=Gottschalkia acidurici (strain ATCC 7906 / DSM 604 / BCRC 14475 / CIP 104303 / KCTC 5404 / NCIMB 10678 / 9a) TaxID=1128398 RepID=K0B4R8_GOTA9|nr:response regulator transcription factor [Gottschalkia acidurici]AFS79571.1 putative transcriptional regulator [Gottschalkia acidurici 9a]
METILLVEDDKSLNRGISFKLERENFRVFRAENIKEAKEIFYSQDIDLIILDVGLPDGNGLDLCREIRKTSEVIIIFLTACDEEIDIVAGLDIGGDDYITKPFSLMVLISKINARLRRNTVKQNRKVTSDDISFYPQDMKLTKNGEDILLSRTELKLIRYLLLNNQQIITKEQLLTELWDIDGKFIDQNTVAVNIRRLREKIEDDPSKPEYIKTVRGMGYIWTEKCVSN